MPSSTLRRSGPPLARRLATAAVCLLVGVLLGGFFLDLDAPDVHVDVPRRNVDLGGDLYRSEPGERVVGVDIPTDRDRVLLEITLNYSEEKGTVRVELRREGGPVVLDETFEPLSRGYVSLEVPGEMLPDGRYRLAVTRLDAGSPTERIARLEVRRRRDG